LHWTQRSAEVIEHPYTFTGNTAVHRAHYILNNSVIRRIL